VIVGATGEDDVQDGMHTRRRMRTGGALLLLAAAPSLPIVAPLVDAIVEWVEALP